MPPLYQSEPPFVLLSKLLRFLFVLLRVIYVLV